MHTHQETPHAAAALVVWAVGHFAHMPSLQALGILVGVGSLLMRGSSELRAWILWMERRKAKAARARSRDVRREGYRAVPDGEQALSRIAEELEARP